MKIKISRFPALSLAVVAMLAMLNAQLTTAFAQGMRFFRISGPSATKITSFQKRCDAQRLIPAQPTAAVFSGGKTAII